MLNRPKYPKPKKVMLVNDAPVQVEIENEEKFSSASNMSLLTSLRTGKVNTYKNNTSDHLGIPAKEIYPTYLDYTYYGKEDVEDNFDFNKEFRKRKDLHLLNVVGTDEDVFVDKDVERVTQKSKERMAFYKLEHQKDVYVSYRLYHSFLGLLEEIKQVQPQLIIVTGKWGLFFLTGCTTLTQNIGSFKDKKPLGGLNKFRASVMQPHECFNLPTTVLVPIIHTVHAIGMLDKVPVMELDIQKLGWMYKQIQDKGLDIYLKPDKQYIVGRDKQVLLRELDKILDKLNQSESKILISIDIETMFKAIIDCIGLTFSTAYGICIPFAAVDNPCLWSEEDEIELMCKIREIMLHPNCAHVGQNYQYEVQYFYKLWGMDIKATHDTMVLHHILYNYLPKDLAFLASLYADTYTYWKDEIDATKETPETRWIYNCKDICYTLEICENLLDVLKGEEQKLQDLYFFQEQRLQPAVVATMNRGVRIDVQEKERLYAFFSTLMQDIVLKINDVLGFEFNQNSTPQKKKVFSDFLGIKLKKKKGGTETCDAAAMLQYIEEYPLYRPFLTLLLEYASLKVFTNNFLGMLLDDDSRARTAYNIAGTGTGRLGSRKNVWGKGGNFNAILIA